MLIDVDDDNRMVRIRGDHDNPMTRGFACFRGMQAAQMHYHPDRILHPLRRRSDGGFERVSIEDALGEIGDRLAEILAKHPPRAVGAFRGTMAHMNAGTLNMLPAWLKAIGSPSYYSTFTIDQSAKWVTADRLGRWDAGYSTLASSDVMMMVGMNPLVSMWGSNAFPMANPMKRLKEAKERGLKLIVIDPRRTETAHFADVFIQPKPGEDPAVAAGLLHIILDRGWHDPEFCEVHVNGLSELREAVRAFTPDYVARRAEIAEDDLERAAETFTTMGRTGACITGTGPSMAPRSNLAEHLYECLNVVCGRYPRAGDAVSNPGVTSPHGAVYAEAVSPPRSWETSKVRHRTHDTGTLFGEMMTGLMADEILTPGEDQLRSLFMVGGNPVVAMPDTAKTIEALSALELFVVMDPFMTETAQLADFILPPRMQYERWDLVNPLSDKRIFQEPYAQYSVPIVEPPAGAELIEEWEVFWELAKRLEVGITINNRPLDMDRRPTNEGIIAHIVHDAHVPFETVRTFRKGTLVDVPPATVQPRRSTAGKFEVAPPDIQREIAATFDEYTPQSSERPRFLLISRRMRHVLNGMFRNIPDIASRVPTNPAFLYPGDLAELGLEEGDGIEIQSDFGCIRAFVRADPGVRPGTVSMAHCWSDRLGDGAAKGANVNELTSTTDMVEPINAMPRFSAIPVTLSRAA
jgi:anaerobic selenocysteine-containing dehydrogenase